MIKQKNKRSHFSGWFRRFNGLLFVCLLVVFIASPLPLGSDRGWASLALSGVCLSLLALHFSAGMLSGFLNQTYTENSRVDSAGYLLLFVAVWFFVQGGLPLPLNILSLFSPATAENYSLAFKVLGYNESNHFSPISLDYGQTFDKAFLSLACFSIVYLMGQLINTKERLMVFCYVVILSGVFQATFGVLMTVTGKEYLFFTAKSAYKGHATGTFVNRNSLAGYLELTLSVGVGFLLGLRKASANNVYQWRKFVRFVVEILLSQVALLRGMLVIMVVGLLMTHSRMGNAAFFNALLITGGIALMSSKSFRKPGFYTILISIVLVDIFLLGTMFDLGTVINRIESTVIESEERNDVVASALKMIPDFWLVGSGAGTFADIFPSYKQQYIAGFYDLAHNDFLQIFVEAGVIGAMPLLLYLIVAIWRSWGLLRHGRTGLSRGMGFTSIMAAICLLIHSSVDFNLQIPANIILFAAVLALPWIALNIFRSAKTS